MFGTCSESCHCPLFPPHRPRYSLPDPSRLNLIDPRSFRFPPTVPASRCVPAPCPDFCPNMYNVFIIF
ncbi:hypothetical protein GYMLUDRAFT_415800 [Collybiopsis luxurians FD-317 M1]|nr:hypothetical protein GYMLUDRAFT_415800 [Collybiopsis luxurians FD-317 M1]